MGTIPARRLPRLMALAYQTANSLHLHPKAILIRSDIHATTSIQGTYQKDPKGLHLTICFKDAEQLANDTHIASHGYVTDQSTTFIHEATHTSEKADGAKKKNGADVWPADLKCVSEVAYGQVPNEEEIQAE
ncbi:hypothetical protein LOZ52_002400 [Ophidiomyces ophidiicola]|nr:hypothetical protein LOZ29_002530 [Ophidiomyces ophidiicola]KAI2220150.1 hypothetical protein LOZ15_002364 [Ophidiomyces ophidiicola]KAI2428571.1 hypothetical protein LOZ52_002400 [Ophidiomyces ophidiicola]KAI2449847.1 Zn finger protein [Ophidiomyces ophidiicola]